jgi:hypothetical protein
MKVRLRHFKSVFQFIMCNQQNFQMSFGLTMKVIEQRYDNAKLCTLEDELKTNTNLQTNHRYLISRLPLHGFYLWRYVLSSIVVVKIWNTIWPLPRSSYFLGGQRWQPIQILYITGRGDNMEQLTIDNMEPESRAQIAGQFQSGPALDPDCSRDY